MPTKIEVRGTRFYSQLKNGEDFSTGVAETALKANSGGKYKAEIDVILTSYHMANLADAYQLHYDSNYEYITKNAGDSFKDIFSVGDAILLKYDHTTVDNESYTADVIGVTDNMLTLEALNGTTSTGERGSFRTTVNASKDQPSGLLINTTTVSDLEFYYNLLPDSDAIGYNSIINGSEQGYRGINIGTNTELDRIGNSQAWVTGEVKASTNSTMTTEPIVNKQFAGTDTYKNSVALGELASNGFTISHEFIVAPLYLDGELDNIENSNPPERLQEGNTLNYIFKVKASDDISDPNKGIEDEVTDIIANVGYVDENYNGGTSNYRGSVSSYTDADGNDLEGIALTGTTTVTGLVLNIQEDAITTGSNVSVIMQSLLTEDKYSGSSVTQEYVKNVNYDDAFTTVDAGSTVNGGRSKIQNFSVSKHSLLPFAFEYSFDVTNLQSETVDDSFFLGILYGDNNNANSDEVMINLDVRNYIKGFYGDDVLGLMTDNYKGVMFWEHDDDTSVVGDGNASPTMWVEDKVVAKLSVDLTVRAKIERFATKLIAYNSSNNDEFTIDSESFNLSEFPMVNDRQVINLEDTRNYLLKEGSPFNNVSLVNGSGSDQLDLETAFTLTYQDYRRLQDADASFYDSSEPNNGLNYDSSNYADTTNTSNWGVYLAIDFDVKESESDTALTTYRFLSQEIEVRDYEESFKPNPDDLTASGTLLTTSDVSTAGSILDSEDTKVRFDFVSSTGFIRQPYTLVVRLEEYQNGGLENIYEISSLRDRLVEGNPLKPITGDYATVTQPSNDTVRVECLIDKDLVDEGKQYELKSRIYLGDDGLIPLVFYEFEDSVGFEFEDSVKYEFE